jgi:hypothetical protein
VLQYGGRMVEHHHHTPVVVMHLRGPPAPASCQVVAQWAVRVPRCGPGGAERVSHDAWVLYWAQKRDICRRLLLLLLLLPLRVAAAAAAGLPRQSQHLHANHHPE